jgi:NADH dehydrogenase
MRHEKIVVLGGTGFIGRYVVARLAAQGRRVVVPTRRAQNAREIQSLPTVEVVTADIHELASLQRVLSGSDAVINLVGLLHDGRGDPYGAGFAQAHVSLPRRLVTACPQVGIRRLVHLSALGVDLVARNPSMYLRSKADGEHAVDQSFLDWTVLRPSVVFGPEDQFLNLFARLLPIAPCFPLAGASCRFAPVYVGDVAAAIIAALDEPASFGQTYELAGPQIFTLQQLVLWVGQVTGHRRPVLPLSATLGRLQAWCLEHLPGPTLMSVDNIDSMAVDQVPSGKVPCFPALLGIEPQALSELAPTWLAAQSEMRHGVGHFLPLRARGHRGLR